MSPYGGEVPEIPATWAWTTLDVACDKIQDGTHFSPKTQLPSGRYRYITAKNIRPSGLDLSDVAYLEEQVHRGIYARCDTRKGDVLLVKDGVNTGYAAINTLDEEVSLLSSVCMLRPKRGILAASFLRYFLLGPDGYRLLTGQMTGTAIKRIILRRIKETPVPIAPISEQNRIVAEIERQLTRLDAAVAALKRIQANLRRYRASVLKAACEGLLVPTEAELARREGRSYETGAQLLARILKERRVACEKQTTNGRKAKYTEPPPPDISDLPELSDGWAWASIDQVIRESLIGLDRGRNQQNNEGIGAPYVKMNNVTMDGRVIFEDLVFVPALKDEQDRFALAEGDILFNTRNSKELVGKAGLVRHVSKGAIYNNNLMRLRFSRHIIPSFVIAYMCSDGFRRRMELVKKATTNVAAVYAKDLFPLQLALPPLAEQRRIVAEVDRRLSLIDELGGFVEASLKRADRLRRAILKCAFEGKLVPQDPNEEPASALLERIRAERASDKQAGGMNHHGGKTRSGRRGKA